VNPPRERPRPSAECNALRRYVMHRLLHPHPDGSNCATLKPDGWTSKQPARASRLAHPLEDWQKWKTRNSPQ
jgi:hypothetical protein